MKFSKRVNTSSWIFFGFLLGGRDRTSAKYKRNIDLLVILKKPKQSVRISLRCFSIFKIRLKKHTVKDELNTGRRFIFMSCMIFFFNSQSGDVVLKNSSCEWNLQLVAVYPTLLIEISKGESCIQYGNVSRNVVFLCIFLFLMISLQFCKHWRDKGDLQNVHTKCNISHITKQCSSFKLHASWQNIQLSQNFYLFFNF